MTVTANIIDVLPDGTITDVSFTVSSVINLEISRENPDGPFRITSCDIKTSNEIILSEAVAEIHKIMYEHGIDLMIPVLNK